MEEQKNPENLYDEEAFDIRLAVVPAGKFINDDGIEIQYNDRIKIAQGRFSLKLTALQALALSQMLNSVEFKEAVNSWAVAEKEHKLAEMKNLNI